MGMAVVLNTERGGYFRRTSGLAAEAYTKDNGTWGSVVQISLGV